MTDTLQDYQTRFVTTASPEVVFAALTTTEGLSAWWTTATGDATAGGQITFTFSPGNVAVMNVEHAAPDRGVRWATTACMVEDWVGTQQHFQLAALPDGGASVEFRHAGLTPALACYTDCLSGWNHFIASLHAYVETGVGQPSGSVVDAARRDEQGRRAAAATP